MYGNGAAQQAFLQQHLCNQPAHRVANGNGLFIQGVDERAILVKHIFQAKLAQRGIGMQLILLLYTELVQRPGGGMGLITLCLKVVLPRQVVSEAEQLEGVEEGGPLLARAP